MTNHPATKLKNMQPWIPFICITVQTVLFFAVNIQSAQKCKNKPEALLSVFASRVS